MSQTTRDKRARKKQVVEIRCDATPLNLFLKLFKGALDGISGHVRARKLPVQCARAETDPAGAGELTVRLYPSDALLRFAATLLAGELDLGTVYKRRHGKSA